MSCGPAVNGMIKRRRRIRPRETKSDQFNDFQCLLFRKEVKIQSIKNQSLAVYVQRDLFVNCVTLKGNFSIFRKLHKVKSFQDSDSTHEHIPRTYNFYLYSHTENYSSTCTIDWAAEKSISQFLSHLLHSIYLVTSSRANKRFLATFSNLTN